MDELEAAKKTPLLDSIGPPKILQYIPESRKVELTPRDSDIQKSEIREDINAYMQSFNININGKTKCEFCNNLTLPWPTLEEQQKKYPDEVNNLLLHYSNNSSITN